MKGRENVRIIVDTIEHLNRNEQPGCYSLLPLRKLLIV